MIAAFATDDGQTFMDRHFGDANRYDIYEINNAGFSFIKTIENSIGEEEEIHADPYKAKGIARLLKQDQVKCLISKKFGANINKMKKKFVCILMNDKQIPDSIKTIQQNLSKIIHEWEKGEDRHFINLKLK